MGGGRAGQKFPISENLENAIKIEVSGEKKGFSRPTGENANIARKGIWSQHKNHPLAHFTK